jgi:hypothetical protein
MMFAAGPILLSGLLSMKMPSARLADAVRLSAETPMKLRSMTLPPGP